MVCRLSQLARNGQKALPEDEEWSGDHPGGPGVVKSPSIRDESGPEALPVGQKWSISPPKGSELVRRPSQWAGSGQEALLEGWE